MKFRLIFIFLVARVATGISVGECNALVELFCLCVGVSRPTYRLLLICQLERCAVHIYIYNELVAGRFKCKRKKNLILFIFCLLNRNLYLPFFCVQNYQHFWLCLVIINIVGIYYTIYICIYFLYTQRYYIVYTAILNTALTLRRLLL